MTEQEKIMILEECMDLDEGTLSAVDRLADYDEWDSISALSFIAVMDKRFNKEITSEQVKTFVTVQDVLDVMK